ncbi:hypothetical protein Q8A73_011020 [Channa argus]|nr:hypothetical protein Q8A73_011020 [Channa argus]
MTDGGSQFLRLGRVKIRDCLFMMSPCLPHLTFPVELGKEKKAKYQTYQRVALVLALVFLVLALCVFSLKYLWSPSRGKWTVAFIWFLLTLKASSHNDPDKSKLTLLQVTRVAAAGLKPLGNVIGINSYGNSSCKIQFSLT